MSLLPLMGQLSNALRLLGYKITRKYYIYISIFLTAFLSTVSADPLVNIETQYYSIYGSTAGTLREELNAKSPVKQGEKIYDAHTLWHVNWRFNWNTKNGKCHITTTSVSVDVNFTLPKWENNGDATNRLQNKWDRYYTALIDHENGHKDFGVNAAREIETEILNLTPVPSCELLEDTANKLGKAILNKYVALEKTYDINTNHGMNNGAIFP